MTGNGKDGYEEWLKTLSPEHRKMLNELPEELARSLEGLTHHYIEMFWEGKREGRIKPAEHFVPLEQLPKGFEYPISYREYFKRCPREMEGLRSWGYSSELAASSARLSEDFGRPFAKFAQAYGEDMVACFEGTPGLDHRVFVLDPWSWKKPYVVAEFENFEAWLAWARQEAMDRHSDSGLP